MKVLNVTILLDPVFGGGTAERTFQMSKALARSGNDCTILTTDIGLTSDRIQSLDGVKVIALPCVAKRFFIVKFSWKFLRELVESADVIHLMGHWSMLNVLVYILAKQTGTPYVVCPAGELSLFGRSRVFKKVFNFVFGYRLVRDASKHIAVTSDEFKAFQAYGINPQSVTIIPNGINESDFALPLDISFTAKFRIESTPFILFMGRLNLIKGPDLLLEAFSLIAHKFPNYHLVFAGPDGGLLNILRQMALDKGLKNRIHFVGYLASELKVSAYYESAFLVIPSRQEAMSIVVLEAGVVGTPVLLTDQCGFNEVEEIGGGYVTKAEVEDLRSKLEMMILADEKHAEMGASLKSFVNENYSWELICNKFLRMYSQILIQSNNKK